MADIARGKHGYADEDEAVTAPGPLSEEFSALGKAAEALHDLINERAHSQLRLVTSPPRDREGPATAAERMVSVAAGEMSETRKWVIDIRRSLEASFESLDALLDRVEL